MSDTVLVPMSLIDWKVYRQLVESGEIEDLYNVDWEEVEKEFPKE